MNTSHALKTLSITNSLGLTLTFRNLRMIRYMSTEPVIQRELKKEKGLRPKREQRRKPKIEPFAKNLFSGKVDTNIIAFPEILNKEELHNLSQLIEPVENSIDDVIKNNSNDIDSNKLVDILKSMEVFAINIPYEHGGSALNVTESCKFKEVLWKDFTLGSKISEIIGNGLDGILELSTNKQKQLYYSKICAGECSPVVCYYEPNYIALQTFQTKAKISPNRNSWILNGEKIVNSIIKNTDLFLVFATTSTQDNTGQLIDTATIFLVDSNLPGVKKTKIDNHHYKILFTDVAVPLENILGKEGQGLELSLKLMVGPRLSVGIASSGIIKGLLAKLSTHAINSNLSNSEKIQEKLGEMACSVYAMDSMIYLTAGLLDGYDDPDCVMESSMVKVYSSEQCLEALLSCIQIFGPDDYLSSPDVLNQVEGMVRLQMLDESNEHLRLLIGLMGLQHAGQHYAATVKKIRNPFAYPGFIVKRLFDKRRFENDEPKLILQLADYVHPSLKAVAEQLEYCVLKLNYLTEMVLIRNGIETPKKQMEINKLAIAAIEIYAMFASLSRASRSYCIGHQLGHYELYLADVICGRGLRKVKYFLSDLESSPHSCKDALYSKLAKQVATSGGNFTEHPLATNF